MVVRDKSSGEVVAAAYWTVPHPDAVRYEEHLRTIETSPEPEMEEDEDSWFEFYFDLLPETSNRGLIIECDEGLDKMRDRVLGSWDHFRLVELATHPEYRRRGLASKLVRKMVDMADKRGMLAYLGMEEEYPARGLYEKLEFEERDRKTIDDLSKFATKEERERVGAGNVHTHVGFLRKPKRPWDDLSDY